MSNILSQKSNKVLCTCIKCHQNDTEEGVGRLIPKSTRTRHRKQEKVPDINSTLSSTTSNLSISNICSSSESESSILMDLDENINFLHTNTSKINIMPNMNINMYVFF